MDEELKKAAEEYATEWHENPDGSAWKPLFEESAIKAFLAGAEWKDRSLNWIRDLVKAAIKKPDEAQGILERIDRMLNKEEEL